MVSWEGISLLDTILINQSLHLDNLGKIGILGFLIAQIWKGSLAYQYPAPQMDNNGRKDPLERAPVAWMLHS